MYYNVWIWMSAQKRLSIYLGRLILSANVKKFRNTNFQIDWKFSQAYRKALLPFKLGAFHPGAPIQPILTEYPNRIDTVTWTWNQPHGAMTVIWLTLAQPMTRISIEFLPVYYPSLQEKQDPKLYANNLRTLMSQHYNVETYDISLEEVKQKYGNRSKVTQKED